jgi:hypothetical protein
LKVELAAARLVPIVREVYSRHAAAIEQHRKAGASVLERPDFLWFILLQSFATMGNSRGQVGLIHNKANNDRLRYENLAAMNDEQRQLEIAEVCRLAGIRMPRKKAEWIAAAFERIKAFGGPEAAKRALMAQPTKAEKERFLLAFAGIGEKYARNIMMDAHHEQFRDSIAVDVRVARISTALGLTFSRPYPDHEAFYLQVAAAAGLSGWDLDRLLYNYTNDIEQALGT